MDKTIKPRRSLDVRGKCRTITLIVPLITDYDWCIFLDPLLILGVIKLENLWLKKIQRLLSLTKAWHRLVIDVFKYIFITGVANLLYLRNFAILQDSCKTVRRWQRYFARSGRTPRFLLRERICGKWEPDHYINGSKSCQTDGVINFLRSWLFET